MKRKPSRSCDERYRHKLNMLGPWHRYAAYLRGTGRSRRDMLWT